MNATEAYRTVLEGARSFGNLTPGAQRKLKRAIAIVEKRVVRMEARLAVVRSKRKTSKDRPLCCQ